jgi:hypothetical protein
MLRLRDLAHANLEVRVHDVLADDLPEGWFDLVHLRLLLIWLDDRRSRCTGSSLWQVTMVAWGLRPPGAAIAGQ